MNFEFHLPFGHVDTAVNTPWDRYWYQKWVHMPTLTEHWWDKLQHKFIPPQTEHLNMIAYIMHPHIIASYAFWIKLSDRRATPSNVMGKAPQNSLVSTNGSYDVCSSVGAPPPNTPTSQTREWPHPMRWEKPLNYIRHSFHTYMRGRVWAWGDQGQTKVWTSKKWVRCVFGLSN